MNRTNGLLANFRHWVPSELLKRTSFVPFYFHMRYTAQVRDQSKSNIVNMIHRTQNKTFRIASFKERVEPSDLVYTNHKILKWRKIITINNFLFIYDEICGNLQSAFSNYFKRYKDQIMHNMSDSNQFTLNV